MHTIKVFLSEQTLELCRGEQPILKYPISSGKNGEGEQNGSGKTPRGRHIVRAIVGKDAPLNAVFVGRRWTGEIYTPVLASEHPERDWILTRILWLSGKEPGVNRWGQVDTMRRYIYIHGTPDTTLLGVPGSKGCIRMKNRDIIELCEWVGPGTGVNIIGGNQSG